MIRLKGFGQPKMYTQVPSMPKTGNMESVYLGEWKYTEMYEIPYRITEIIVKAGAFEEMLSKSGTHTGKIKEIKLLFNDGIHPASTGHGSQQKLGYQNTIKAYALHTK